MAYHYPPQVTSGALRATRFGRYLPEFGYDPQVIALGSSDGPGLPGVEYFSPWEGNSLKRTFHHALRLAQRFLLDREGHKMEWAPGAVGAAKRLARRAPFDAVISTGPPLATHAAALFLKRALRIPWIADFRDPIISPIVDASKYDFWLERRFFAGADMAISVTDQIVEGWRKRYPEYAHKFEALWNGFDPEEPFGPAPLPAREGRLISHIGDIYGPRHPSRFVASLYRLMQRDAAARDIRIDFIGPMDLDSPCRAMPEFQDFVARGVLTYNEAVAPRARALQATAESDWLLLLDLNDKGIGYAAPAKIFDYVRSGRPILAYTPAASAVEHILRNSGARHACVYPGDSLQEEDRKVAAFLSAPSCVTEPSEWFWERFDGRRQTHTLADCLDRVTGRGGR